MKKLSILILSVFLIIAISAIGVKANMIGDCDGSNSIGAPDLNKIIYYMNGNTTNCINVSDGTDITNQTEVLKILDINNNGAVDMADLNLLEDVLGETYDYWVYTNITQCNAGNWFTEEISDTQGFFTAYTINIPCVYISNYVPTNGTCNSDGTLITAFVDMSYNSSSDIRSYNITQNCNYNAPSQPSVGDGSGPTSSYEPHNYAPVINNQTNTRTLEQPKVAEQPQPTQTVTGPTGAVTAGNTNITNYALGGIIGLAIIVAGFFLWKKYK